MAHGLGLSSAHNYFFPDFLPTDFGDSLTDNKLVDFFTNMDKNVHVEEIPVKPKSSQ